MTNRAIFATRSLDAAGIEHAGVVNLSTLDTEFDVYPATIALGEESFVVWRLVALSAVAPADDALVLGEWDRERDAKAALAALETAMTIAESYPRTISCRIGPLRGRPFKTKDGRAEPEPEQDAAP